MVPHDLPAASGIYRITCITTGKLYIGSAINIQKRRREHIHGLRSGTHANIALQRAFNKYGESDFTFEVIELVLPPFLIAREQHWFDTLQPFGPKRGYNIDRVAGSRYGSTVSPETREKLRIANLGKQHGEETKRKHAEAGARRHHTEATKEKVRLIRLGTKRSAESCERSRTSQLGKKQSAETIEKRRQSRLGYSMSEESRAKSSASNVASNAWRMKTLIVTAPDGTVYTAHGIGQFAKEHNLNRSALTQVAMGNAPHHKGWTARYLE